MVAILVSLVTLLSGAGAQLAGYGRGGGGRGGGAGARGGGDGGGGGGGGGDDIGDVDGNLITYSFLCPNGTIFNQQSVSRRAADNNSSHALPRGSRDCSQLKPQSRTFVISQPSSGFPPTQP